MMLPYRGRIFRLTFAPVFRKRYSASGSYRSICLKMFRSGISPIRSFVSGAFRGGGAGSCREQAKRASRHTIAVIDRLNIGGGVLQKNRRAQPRGGGAQRKNLRRGGLALC